MGTGTTVEITGVWQRAPPNKEQGYELKAEDVRVVGGADAEVRKLGLPRSRSTLIVLWLHDLELTNLIRRDTLSKKSIIAPNISDPYLILGYELH